MHFSMDNIKKQPYKSSPSQELSSINDIVKLLQKNNGISIGQKIIVQTVE